MLRAFALGTLAQSSLLLAGLLVCWVRIPTLLIGILAGAGAGSLLAAISFDLLPETSSLDPAELGLWMMIGVAVFLVGDWAVERKFGAAGTGAAMGIVVGSVVDGVPESIIFGIQIGTGLAISASFLAAVMVSNVPQAMAPSADLVAAGWKPLKLGALWLAVVLACGVASAVGYLFTSASSAAQGDRAAALAAGGLLAMLVNSLIPFAYERGRQWAGTAAAVGFTLGYLGS
jgi:ZIP family zinc transporter